MSDVLQSLPSKALGDLVWRAPFEKVYRAMDCHCVKPLQQHNMGPMCASIKGK